MYACSIIKKKYKSLLFNEQFVTDIFKISTLSSTNRKKVVLQWASRNSTGCFEIKDYRPLALYPYSVYN